MLDIYEKLTPIVGSKGGVKEEVIEDVEMEDAMCSSNSKHSSRFEGKKEPSDRSVSKATSQKQVPHESKGSSVKGEVKTEHSEESIPVISDRSAKDVKVESKEVTGDNVTKPQEGKQSNQKPHSDDSTSSKQEVNSSDSELSKQDSVKQESSPVSKNDGEKKSEQDTK